MNTQTFTLTRKERQQFEAAWRNESPRKPRAPKLYLLQAVLRGRDPLKGFSPVTNANKLANGQTAWQSYNSALAAVTYQPDRYLAQAWPRAQASDAPTESRLLEISGQLQTHLRALAKGGA